MSAGQSLVHAESWDEDFDFQRSRRRRPGVLPVRASTSTAENWDDDFEDQSRHSPRSQQKQYTLRSSTSKSHAENWDDDFEDHRQDSPRFPRSSTTRSTVENWDDEFANNNPPVLEDWDDELDGAQSSDDDLGCGDKEDRTVTARSRRVAPSNLTPPPPFPPLPDDLNIRDHALTPTTSIFSLPTSLGTNRPESSAGYSFNSTLGLRGTISGGPVRSSAHRFATLPASPPIHKERRRLRKKSRPSHVDGTLIELEDRSPDQRIGTPPRPSTPEVIEPSPGEFRNQTSPNANTSTGSNKAPLLSRIGSVKKWRPGRKRLSSEPQEVVQQDGLPWRERRSIDHDFEVTPRPPSVMAKVQQSPSGGGNTSSANGSRIFKIFGQVGESRLTSEKSLDKISLHLSPTRDRSMKKSSRDPSPSPSPLYGMTRRPSSMMVNASGGSGKPRHASSGAVFWQRPASVSRTSFSASVEDLTYRMTRPIARNILRKEKGKDEEEEEEKVFIRRLSFGSGAGHGHGVDHGGGDGSNVKMKTTERDKDRRHRKSKSFVNVSTRLLDKGNESVVSNAPPQIPDLSISPSPLFTSPPEFASLQADSKDLLLPAIEMEPAVRMIPSSFSAPVGLLPSVSTDSSSEVAKPSSLLISKVTASPQQSASLGRSAQPPKNVEPVTSSGAKVVRRNSLSDLKIPVRISQAQTGLKRDLGMVKEFARSVELIKELQVTYNSLISEVQGILNTSRTRPSTPAPPSRPISPTDFFTGRRRSRSSATAMPRSTATAQLSNAVQDIETKYAVTWECAELLIELGGGPAVAAIAKAPSQASLASSSRIIASTSEPPDVSYGWKSRERAITLAGDEPKPAVPAGLDPSISVTADGPQKPSEWRASAGKHDLSQRQLVLLREMLTHSEANLGNTADVPTLIDRLEVPAGEAVNKQWRWGNDAASSTVTLPPSEESSVRVHDSSGGDKSLKKKRRSSRLGMSVVRDMLRSLKRSVTEQAQQQVQPPSSGSSIGLGEHGPGRRRAKTSTGPDSNQSIRDRESPFPHNYSLTHPRSPYGTSAPKSPRRPSLASIFRFNKANKSSGNSTPSGDQSVGNFRQTPPASSSAGTGSGQLTTEDEEDWDRVDDSNSDLDPHSPRVLASPNGSSTLRVRNLANKEKNKSPYMYGEGLPPPEPVTPRRGPDASRSSIWEGTWSRGTKLSNVEELAENQTPIRSQLKKLTVEVSGLSPNRSLKKHHDRPPSRSKRLSGVSPALPPPLSKGGNSGSVRSVPPGWVEHLNGHGEASFHDLKLAMTPENIKPLLENAREVHLRCTECVAEMKLMLCLGEAART